VVFVELTPFVKSEREDLTPQQIKVLAELMKDLKDG